MPLKELTEEIDQLIAEAGQEEPDSEKRLDLIKKASSKACQFFMQFVRDVDGVIPELLEKAELASIGKAVSVGDLMHSNDALAPFRDPKALSDCLKSMSNILIQKGFSREMVNEATDEVMELLPQMKEQKLSGESLMSQLQMLQTMFCNRPPDGGSGSPKKPKGPKGGGGLSKWERRLRFIQTAIGVAGSAIGILWPHHGETPQTQPPKEPVPLVQPAYMELVAIIALAAFASSLHARGEIPEEAVTPVPQEVEVGA